MTRPKANPSIPRSYLCTRKKPEKPENLWATPSILRVFQLIFGAEFPEFPHLELHDPAGAGNHQQLLSRWQLAGLKLAGRACSMGPGTRKLWSNPAASNWRKKKQMLSKRAYPSHTGSFAIGLFVSFGEVQVRVGCTKANFEPPKPTNVKA